MTMSPEARALLDAAREGLAPDAAALRRVRMKVDAAVAGGVAAGGSAVLAKLAIVVGVAGIVAAGVALRAPSEHAISPRLSFAPAAIEAPPPSRAADDAPPVVTYIEMPAQSARASSAISQSPPPSPVQPAAAPTAAEPVAVIGLAREVELVDAAMAALKRGDAHAALASVRLHREETRNHGQLAEDADAIEIEALCRLHDRRVFAKLEAFDARWPESAQRSRLTTTCP
jgi:hypothetical protein